MNTNKWRSEFDWTRVTQKFMRKEMLNFEVFGVTPGK
jgi:hypothetical protein